MMDDEWAGNSDDDMVCRVRGGKKVHAIVAGVDGANDFLCQCGEGWTLVRITNRTRKERWLLSQL